MKTQLMSPGQITATSGSNISFFRYIRGNYALSFFLWFMLVGLEILIASVAIISPISLLVIIALMVVMILMIKVEYAVFNLIFWMYPAPSLQLFICGINLTILQLAGLLAIISLGYATLARTIRPYPGSKCDIPLILFGGWTLLSFSWSHNHLNGIMYLIQFTISLASFFIVIAIIRSKKSIQTVFGIIILMGIINASLTLYYPYTEFYIKKSWEINEFITVKCFFWPKNQAQAEGRAMGFGTAHSTSALMALPITFAIMLFFVTQNIRKRYWLMFVVLLMYAACTATLAKGPLLSLILGVAFVTFHLKPLRRKFITIMLITVMVTIALFCLTRVRGLDRAISGVATDLQVRADDPERETSLGNRIIAWTVGAKKLRDTFGFGTGAGGFNQYLPFKHIDGTYPGVLFELGFVGLGLFLWILYRSYRFFIFTIKKCPNEYFRRMLIIYLGGYVTILVSWIVSFSYIHIYLWFYLGVGFAIAHQAKIATADPKHSLPFSKDGDTIVVV